MDEKAERLLAQALRLPTDDRAQLAAELIASIDDEAHRDTADAWAAEIERRAARALEGKSSGRPSREVLDRLHPDRGE